MAQFDVAFAAPVAEIAESHHRTVAAILRAVRQGLFTAAEAGALIDRVRAQATKRAPAAHDHANSGSPLAPPRA